METKPEVKPAKTVASPAPGNPVVDEAAFEETLRTERMRRLLGGRPLEEVILDPANPNLKERDG
ncbi:MAG: hypothetical protein HQL56_11630 [Magnetococcales bacterium]|nr:hypothetical protein [Magnetococcales bacterium]